MRKKDIKKIFNICAKSSEINIDPEDIKNAVMEKIGMSNKEKFYTTHEEEEAVEPTFVTAPKKSKGITALKIAAVGIAAAACFCVTALGIGMFGEGGISPALSHDNSANNITTEISSDFSENTNVDETVTSNAPSSDIETTEKSALSLLNCRVNEDGAYYIDQTNLSDDYELFRKYFFGTWEGSFCFPATYEQKRLIIDDTENSFVMTDPNIKILNGFYETGANAVAFMIGSPWGPATFWISLDEPDTLYTAWGGTMDSPLWSYESGQYSTVPVVYTLTKTNEPLNEPESDFLSIFKLYEMAKEYRIDPELLINIKYEIDGTTLYHDDWYQLYPMYLVSEAENKIVIRTSVGNVYETEKEPIEVLCTFEKEEGEWNRSSESGITLTGKCLSQDQLVSFEPDYEWARTYIDNWYISDFLNSLEDPGFKDLYCKALTLIRLLSTDINFAPSDAVLAQGDERAQLLLDGEGGLYLESGYTIDSFRETYYSVFTKETADIILATHSIFYSYSGELWYRPITAGDDITKVFEEYELTDQTDTVLEFKRISYHVDIGEPIDYDPAKKEEYKKSEVDFRFVKTEDGWRAEKFLDAAMENQLLV